MRASRPPGGHLAEGAADHARQHVGALDRRAFHLVSGPEQPLLVELGQRIAARESTDTSEVIASTGIERFTASTTPGRM